MRTWEEWRRCVKAEPKQEMGEGGGVLVGENKTGMG